MNKTQQLLKQRDEAFDEQYTSMAYGEKWRPGMEITPSMVKSFHATTISLLLTSLKEEIKNKKGWSTIGGERYIKLDDISTLLSETISNLQTKK